MQQINVFRKGAVTDLDYSVRSQDSWDFPSLNIRILNKKGQGFIVTPIDGNTNPSTANGEEFSLSLLDGTYFVPIGAEQYNGIVYIVSYHEASGQGEIGTFPSPSDWTNPNNSTFVREYKILKNFTLTGSSTITEFRSAEFNFAITNMVDVLIKPSYDDSIDLYLADYRNPVRVINSGFNQDGNITGRYHQEEEFLGAINQILTSQVIPQGTLSHIRSGGSLRPGNIFLFIRYLNSNYNRTPFVMELGPFQMHNGNSEFAIDGLPEVNGILQNWNTDKKIEITLTNLDESYKFIEIAVVRWTGLENVLAQPDTYLIAKYYEIADIISNSGLVTIFGDEDQSTLSFEEIVATTINETIPRTHTQLEDRYFGANWKKIDYNRDALIEYARLITIDYDTSKTLADATYLSIVNGYGDYSQHKKVDSPNITYDYTGYFRGEIYPYAIVGLLSDGTETEAFPCTGNDAIGIASLVSATPSNSKGLYRFPMRGASQTDAVNVNDDNKVLGVKLDNTASIAYKNANPLLFTNIVGFYYVRGDRKHNLLYQGTSFNIHDYATVNSNNEYFGGTNSSDCCYVPYFYNDFPGAKTDGTNYYYGSYPLHSVSDRLAIVSPEHILSLSDKIIDGETLFISPINSFIIGAGREVYTIAHVSPSIYSMDMWGNTATAQTSENFTSVRAYNIQESQFKGPERFTSYLRDGKTQSNIGWNAVDGSNTYYNRSLVTTKYLGLIYNSGAAGFSSYKLYNVYRAENNASLYDDYVNVFSVKNTVYSKISQLIGLGTNTSSEVYYKGDCFLQRTFFRTWRWFGFDDNTDTDHMDNGGALDYRHGCLLGQVTETAVNTAMRNQVEGQSGNNLYMYSYFPKTETIGRSKTDFILFNYSSESLAEALQINDGYNVMSSGKTYTGYDSTTPVLVNKRPNRIRFSSQHESGSFFDGYRNILINSYEDYNMNKGEIMGLEELQGLLCSIQRNTINQHHIGQRKFSSEDGEVTLVDSNVYLAKETRMLSDFGSQHQWSIKKTPNGIYGVDFRRKIIWGVSLQSSATGGVYLGANPLSESKSITKKIYEILDNERTDVVEEYPDTPMNGNGIVTGYDAKYKDVMFTFLKRTESEEYTVVDGEDVRVSEESNCTLVFNENIQAFTSEYSFTPGIYMNINNDLFSSLDVQNTLSGLVYLHNRESSILTFYGTLESMIISYIVNGMGEQNATPYEKMFLNYKVESGEEEFDKVVYETEYQEGTQDPFLDIVKFWETPEYLENHWDITINVKTDAAAGDFDVDSGMRGTYLKVSLYYKKAIATHIRKVITEFIISKA